MKISINKITVGKVAMATFVITSGVYIGNWCTRTFVIPVFKTVDSLILDGIKSMTAKIEEKEKKDEEESNND